MNLTSAQTQLSTSPLVVIPTYNERENLRAILLAVHAALPKADVLVVDDGSPDGTGQLADEMSAELPWLFVLHREGKLGLGTAYRDGFNWGLCKHYTHFFEMDADFSHDPNDLPRLLAATQEADFSLGSRWVSGGGTQGWPLKRQILSRCGSFYARTILGVDIRDLTGGFKCFKRGVLEGVGLTNMASMGYGFQIELTWRALRAGYCGVEVPIIFQDRVAGHTKMSGGIFFEALGLVWKLRLGLL